MMNTVISPTAQDLVEIGNRARRVGDRAGALASYEAAAAADPQCPSVLVDIAAVLRELGRLDEAEAALERLLAIEPTHFDALIERGHVLRRRGDRKSALGSYEAAAAIYPKQLGVLVDIASVLRELGRLDEAEAVLKQVLAIQPTHFGALIERGHVLRRRGDRASALASYQEAAAADPQRFTVLFNIASVLRELGHLDEAEAALQHLLAIEPTHFGALIERGHVLRRRGDPAAALASYEAAAAADSTRLGVLVDIASVQRELRRLDEAEAVLQRLLAIEPTHFGALIERGHVLRHRGDRAGALAAYQAAAAADPLRHGVLVDIASVLREMGHLDEADATLNRLSVVEPQNTRLLRMIGSARMAVFRLDEAEQYFREALEASPHDVETHIQLGHLARRRGHRAKALEHFNAAHLLYPSHLSVQLEIAAEFRDQGRITEAQDILEKLIKSKSANVQTWMHLGRFYRSIAENRSALNAFQTAFNLRPDDAEPLVEMSREYRSLGNPKTSKNLLHQALEIDPTHIPALNQLAEHSLMAENFEDSLKLSRRAIQIQPCRFWSYIYACRATAELGRQQEALDFLSQARKKCGNHPEIEAAQAALFRRNRDFPAAKSTLDKITPENRTFFSIWEQWTELAISTANYELAEEALQNPPNSTPHERSRTFFLRGRLAEAQWQLEAAAAYYRCAITIDPNDSLVHNEMAGLCLKLHDLENGYIYLKKRTILSASTRLLRGGNLNASQSHLGHMYDEYTLDRSTLSQLKTLQSKPSEQKTAGLLQLVREKPDYTPVSLALLVTLRRSGELKQIVIPVAATPPVASTPIAIPNHIAQFWDTPDPPAQISELNQTWKKLNPTFKYSLFNINSASQFLLYNFPSDVQIAFKRAQGATQAADLFRLAYLFLQGGFYCDADDRCLGSLSSFVPSYATFVGYLEGHGSIANNFIGAVPKHPVIERALKLAVTAINRGDHDEPWLSTGPGLLSRAFSQILSETNSYPNLLEKTAIFDVNYLQRHIGFHCPADYKKTSKHWRRALLGRKFKTDTAFRN
jgi:tetratricopeptide (TPR) repeat protein